MLINGHLSTGLLVTTRYTRELVFIIRRNSLKIMKFVQNRKGKKATFIAIRKYFEIIPALSFGNFHHYERLPFC